MSHARAFSQNYQEARSRFREAAQAVGTHSAQFPIVARGPADEELTLDLAMIGPPRPQRAVVISSGLHGVEGFFGSAI
jgi:hypothetical protein